MIKLRGYIKPFLLGLIAAIVLLFGQALCDLNLPNLMSSIVNVGIQQNGMEHAAPDALSQNAMRLMAAFMNEREEQLVLNHYTLTDSAPYESMYPNADTRLYIKNPRPAGSDYTSAEIQSPSAQQNGDISYEAENNADNDEELDRIFGVSVWMLNSVMRGVELPEIYKSLPLLEELPENIISTARMQALAIDETLLKQSGIMFAKAFYAELGADLSAMQTRYIVKIGLFMLLIALLGGAAAVLVSLLSSKIAVGVARNLRRDVFNKITSFTNDEFDRFSTASLITRCTNDVTQIQQLLLIGIRMVCYAPIMGIGGIVMALSKTASLSWIIAVAVVIVLGMIMTIMAIALPKFKLIQKLMDKLNLVSRENLSGLMVIRAFRTQRHEKKRFDDANKDLTSANLFVNRAMIFMMPTMMLIMNGMSLLVVWHGAGQIASSAMQVGDMMAFMQYSMQVLMAFVMISAMFILVPRAAVSAGRIAEVLEMSPSIADPESPKAFAAHKKGVVEFKNVHFRYHGADEDALSDISFTAKAGQTTAFIGSTGSGKSTVASLILRFYDVTQGEILVDGIDIREVSQQDLRAKIGYVPQKGVLISGTIESNLKYGRRDASEQDVITAATVAQAMEFITEKDGGFDSHISQGGANVSGGQRQRLSIARALAKNPEIFIFDDSFSALDFQTDVSLRKALKQHAGDSTLIVVAQRVGTIMNAEQIIVLDAGRVVGRGTHRELLDSCPVYYEIASSQLSKEELA